MGTIVCQTCNKAIVHFENEKVTKLYATGSAHCVDCQKDEKE
ncbi:GapA-binding peptide SR1P [Bacillus solitudinis]|nr:GapA-binding peptide SR1P [Bacillus solitudinis]